MFRVGIIGVGNMGTGHLDTFKNNLAKDAKLTALCDINPKKIEKLKEDMGDSVAYFEDAHELIHSGLVDGIIIATPHYPHPELSMEALKAGLHVFCEKPIGVYTKNIVELNEFAKKSNKAFQIDFLQRVNPVYKKIKELLDGEGIGEFKRVTWIITDWYRNQAYFNSGGWRATWSGEGGGTLLNQNPHQLDLLQWFVGMPSKVRGFCYFGKNRDVEIEDEATIYMEFPNGATGTYITSVSEYPGTNRLEIAGTKGKIIFENNKITYLKLEMDERDFNKQCDSPSHKGIKKEVISYELESDRSKFLPEMTNNWIGAALNGTKLIAPAEEGINSLSISNAAYLSTWNNDWVTLPIDHDDFYNKLQEQVKNSTFEKKNVKEVELSVSESIHN